MALDFIKAINGKPEWADIEDEDEFLTEFHKDYVHRDYVAKDPALMQAITGRRMGSFEAKLATYYPEDFNTEEIKDKKAEEKAEALLNHFKSKWETTQAALDEVKKGGADDKKFVELTEKYQQLEGKWKVADKQAQEFKALADNTKSEYEGKLKGVTVNTRLEKLMAKIPFADGISELAIEGFENKVKSSLKFELNDKGDLEVYDAQTGEPIARDKNAGIMTPEEALTALATKHKIIKMHNGPAAPTKKVAEPVKKEYNRVLPNNPIRNKMGQQ